MWRFTNTVNAFSDSLRANSASNSASFISFIQQLYVRRRQRETKFFRLGSEEFRQQILAAAAQRIGATNYGTERRETEEAKPPRLVEGEMDRIGWTKQFSS